MSEQNGNGNGGGQLTPRERQARAIAVVVDEFRTVPEHLLMTDHLEMMMDLEEKNKVIAGLEAVRPSPAILQDWYLTKNVNAITHNAVTDPEISSMFELKRRLGGAFGKAYMAKPEPEYWRRAHEFYQLAFELAETPIEKGTVMVDRMELNIFNYQLGGDGLKTIEHEIHLAEGCVLEARKDKEQRKEASQLNARIEGVMAANNFNLHPVTGNLHVVGDEREASSYVSIGVGEARTKTKKEIEATLSHLAMTRTTVPVTGTSKAIEAGSSADEDTLEFGFRRLGAALDGLMVAASDSVEPVGWEALPQSSGSGSLVGGWDLEPTSSPDEAA